MSKHSSYGSSSAISEQIRQEIQRFESVHPCIYAIYDLLDSIPDPYLAHQIRENVVCIEDSFVNSQEWTLSRCTPDLKLGVLGSLTSGKSALVHRYLTGSYMQEESPEGGRFKKEVTLDGQPYLLMIRDEGGPPEQQFTHWVDAVMFVFSLENESSFNCVYNYYAKMAHYRNVAEIPLILVGTQDAICTSKPRLIDDSRARKLANDLKRCGYYETCATYGLNVERVFRDACLKIIQQRNHMSQTAVNNAHLPILPPPSSCPGTPSHNTGGGGGGTSAHQHHHQPPRFNFSSPSPTPGVGPVGILGQGHPQQQQHFHTRSGSHVITVNNGAGPVGGLVSGVANSRKEAPSPPCRKQHPSATGSASSSGDSPSFPGHAPSCSASLGLSPATSNHSVSSLQQWSNQQHSHSTPCGSFAKDHDFKQPSSGFSVIHLNRSNLSATNLDPNLNLNLNLNLDSSLSNTTTPAHHLPTPSSTPTTQRKNRRISNIFNRKEDEKSKSTGNEIGVGIGIGRAIPVKQGNLCKKSNKALNKDWKKKYVCLYKDGRLMYYPSLRDYMEDNHGKEIYLGHTTVKVPGQRPRGTTQQNRLSGQQILTNGLAKDFHSQKLGYKEPNGKVLLTSFESIKENQALTTATKNANFDTASSQSTGTQLSSDDQNRETPNFLKKKEKKHVRKSSNFKGFDNDDSENYEFIIVSMNNKQWHFEAESGEEREQWVQAIEQQILASLQSNSSNKSGSARAHCDRSAVQALRSAPGNANCADCGSPSPDWASLNFGTLICIECCGIHRNLGSHISKVRSLDLDEWPIEYINVMQAIGNKTANGIWEFNTKGRLKPTSNSPREPKTSWIKAKYENREFLCPPPPSPTNSSLVEQIAETICKKDLRAVYLLLAHCSKTPQQINATLGDSDLRAPLHLACAAGSPAIAQLLIWYNADVKALDEEGRSPLWYAKNSGSRECMDVLVHSGCPSDFYQQQRISAIPGPTQSSALSQASSTTSLSNGGGPGITGNAGSGPNSARKSQQNSQNSAIGPNSDVIPILTHKDTKNANDAFENLPASVI